MLCRSVNPLGKCIEFVQEDMDQMDKELGVWRRAYKEETAALEAERQ